MKYPAYPKYKKSGVEWLGDLPEHWEVKRLKTSAIHWVSNVDKVPSENEVPVKLCNYTDVYYNDFITSDMELMETTATKEEIEKFHLNEEDVVITKDSESWDDIAISALVTKTTPDLVCGYHLAIIRPKKEKLSGRYLLRELQCSQVNHQFQIAATGVTRYGLPKSAIGEALIPLPPFSEQQAIAAFLDRETGRIDSLISKKQKLIELLKEKRTALISRAVTKGLSPKVKMKPSGVEWLGDVPEHWAVVSLRHLFDIKAGGDLKEEFYSEEKTEQHFYPIYTNSIKSNEVYGFSSKPFFKSNTITVTGRGEIGYATYRDHEYDAIIRLLVLTPKKKVPCKYYVYFINSMLNFFGGSTAVSQLSTEQISPYKVFIPPFPEQQVIVDFLDHETNKIAALIAKVETVIEKLKEYRTGLISAAVTGKIMVGTRCIVPLRVGKTHEI